MQEPQPNEHPSQDELAIHGGLHVCLRCYNRFIDHLPFTLLEPVNGFQTSGLYCPGSPEFKHYTHSQAHLPE